jgi:hypothetical protein
MQRNQDPYVLLLRGRIIPSQLRHGLLSAFCCAPFAICVCLAGLLGDERASKRDWLRSVMKETLAALAAGHYTCTTSTGTTVSALDHSRDHRPSMPVLLLVMLAFFVAARSGRQQRRVFEKMAWCIVL